MRKVQAKIGRRKALMAAAGILGGVSLSSTQTIASGSPEIDTTRTSTDPDDDPMHVYLSNGYLHVDTSQYEQYVHDRGSSTLYVPEPPADGSWRGGPSEIPVDDVEAAIDGINSSKNAGDALLYAYMSNPPIPMVEYDTGTIAIRNGGVERADHNCDTTNDIDWETTWTKNIITITLDEGTAHEIGDMLQASALAADVSAVIMNATGVGAVPGWVASAIGVLVTYWAGDWTFNIGDCGIEQEIIIYGGFPVPFYELTPIGH